MVRARGLQGADCVIYGLDVGCGGARVRGPVDIKNAGGFGVGEYGVLLGFARMGGRFTAWLIADLAGGSPFWSSVGHFELSLQPFPGSERHVPVEGVGEVLHRDNALVQDRDLIIRFRARHAVGSETFA